MGLRIPDNIIGRLAAPGLLAGIGLVMAGFYAADQYLARLERREIGAVARRLDSTGESLLTQGRTAAAVDALTRAHLTERDNRSYQLALARALIADRQPAKAIEILREVLDEDSNDGEANLLTARALTAEMRWGSAEAHYHRAIYGSWPPGQASRSVQARVELVGWLTEHGDRQSLLAELIPLEQRARSDSAIASQIPALYLQANAVGQAEEAYRALIHAHPGDPDAYAGLGRVELKRGNFHAAQQHFDEALERKPGDPGLLSEAARAHAAYDLDPTLRKLPGADKLLRANRILAMARDVAQSCAEDPALMLRAQKLLDEKPPKFPANEVAEERLDLAESLWRSRPASCHPAPEQTGVLALLMGKIAQ